MEWHITTPAGPKGPVDIDLMRKLAADGLMDADTLVWKAGFNDWIPVSRCPELGGLMQRQVPPPIADKAMGDGLVWALALLPLWGILVQMLATQIRVAISGETFVRYAEMWWVIIVVNIVMTSLDLSRIKTFGHDVRKLKWWMYLIVPVYVYQRDKLVKATMTRFWVWIGAFLLAQTYFQS